MGANSTQALGTLAALVAGSALAAGVAFDSFILYPVGLAAAAASVVLFLKCKPWEHAE